MAWTGETWIIYSIGDLDFLYAVLNSIGAIVSSTNLFQDIFVIGVLAAVLMLGFQHVFGNNSGIGFMPFHRFIVGWAVYSFMFGSTVTVSLYDSYSLAVKNVDNIPAGIAIFGSVVSKMSYEITDKMEQAFSLPNMTEHGFSSPLYMLMKARDLDLDIAGVGGDPDAPSKDLQASLYSYIADCTNTGIEFEQLSLSSIMQNPDPLQALGWGSDVYTTKMYIGSTDGTIMTCTEAHAALVTEFSSSEFWDAWEPYLKSRLGTNYEVPMNVALDMIVGETDLAKKYMLSAVVRKSLENGLAFAGNQQGDFGSTILLTQAQEQRNTQWAAQSSLFLTVVRPMMAFFEAFFYATAPFMVLSVALMAISPSMIVRYLQFSFWVQTWMPVMAILNFYVNWVAQDKLADYSAMTGKLKATSIAGMIDISTSLGDWIATAGLLASSTPAISMMLIYGGSVAATHLAGRLQSGDHINEKTLSPDIAQPGPVVSSGAILQQSAQMTQTPLEGRMGYGAQNYLPSFDIGQNIQQSSSEAQTASVRSMEQFGSSLSKALSKGVQGSEGWTHSTGLASSLASSTSKFDQAISKAVDDIDSKHRLSSEQKDALGTALTGSLAGALSTPGGGNSVGQIKAGLEGKLSNTFTEGKMGAISDAANFVKSASTDEGIKSELRNALVSDAKDGTSEALNRTVSAEDSKKLRRDASQAYEANQNYQRTNQLASRYGAAAKMDAAQLSSAIVNNQALGLGYLESKALAASPELAQRASQLQATNFGLQQIKDPQVQRGAALLMAMSEKANQGDGNARNSLVDMVSQASGAGVRMDANNPKSGDGIMKRAAIVGASAEGQAGPLSDPSGEVNKILAKKEEVAKGVQGRVDGGPGAVAEHREKGSQDVKDAGKRYTAAVREEQLALLQQAGRESFERKSAAQSAFEVSVGGLTAAKDGLTRGLEVAATAAGAGAVAGGNALYDSARQRLDTLGERLDGVAGKFHTAMQEAGAGAEEIGRGISGGVGRMIEIAQEKGLTGILGDLTSIKSEATSLSSDLQGRAGSGDAGAEEKGTLAMVGRGVEKIFGATGDAGKAVLEADSAATEAVFGTLRDGVSAAGHAGLTAASQVMANWRQHEFGHAKSMGLTDSQAGLYAEARVSIGARTADSIGDVLPTEPFSMRNVSPTVGEKAQTVDAEAGENLSSDMIIRAAQTGSDYDLRAVGEMNRMRSDDTYNET